MVAMGCMHRQAKRSGYAARISQIDRMVESYLDKEIFTYDRYSQTNKQLQVRQVAEFSCLCWQGFAYVCLFCFRFWLQHVATAFPFCLCIRILLHDVFVTVVCKHLSGLARLAACISILFAAVAVLGSLDQYSYSILSAIIHKTVHRLSQSSHPQFLQPGFCSLPSQVLETCSIRDKPMNQDNQVYF